MRFSAICCLAALTTAACSSTAPPTTREPPTFQELTASLQGVERDDLRLQMWSLATSVRNLESAFARGAAASGDGRTEIAALLAEMESTAMRLEVPAYRLHHAQAGLGAFRSEVRAAREAVAREPPDYTFAGRVIESCAYCHR